jgi:RimJ/RimL family protein N-acetyltransferase
MLPLPPNTISRLRINKSLLRTINISMVCFCALITKLLTSAEIVMIAEKIRHIDGHNLSLRLIQPDDAEYVFGLRINPVYNEHLSNVTGLVEDQRQWIETYKSREAKLSELYYVIERKDGLPCGVVRLYDVKQDSLTWDSWILDHNKPTKAALESATLSFGIGFEQLGLARAYVDVRIENTKALAIYQRLGMIELRRDQHEIFFCYDQTRFLSDKPHHLTIIKGELQR